jgi:hypothetical protein
MASALIDIEMAEVKPSKTKKSDKRSEKKKLLKILSPYKVI